ncbi:MAG TPA: hypothetical protein VLM89_13255 [Phycisphaerae bacterium]|nr:hypothetical protein [Phycisphaerae bacterium]
MPDKGPITAENRAWLSSDPNTRRLARLIFVSFVFTFLAARCVVFLIMSRRIPDLYFFIGQTHVHHLNYGIFLLSGVGAYLILSRPQGRMLSGTALVYGIGLGLTFDEFGMWLHLGGGYWQRASFDAVIVIAGLLGLAAVSPPLRLMRFNQWTTIVVLLLGCALYVLLMNDSLCYLDSHIAPRLQQIEERAPQ